MPATFGTLLTTQHVDLGLALEGGVWEPHLHVEFPTEAEFAPNQALLFVDAAARLSRPAGTQWDFLGVAEGEDVWILPETENPALLFLGVGTEEIDPTGVASYFEPAVGSAGPWIKLGLASVRGPGHFSLYSTNLGDPVPFIASANGVDASDALFVPAGGHAHFNFGFTAVGTYEVSFVASAFDPDTLAPIVSKPFTYTFAVQNILTNQHVDVDIAFETGEFELGLHDETNDTEIAADNGLVHAGPEAKVTRPAGSQWNFLGTPAGKPVWVLPQTQDPNLVFLGVASEEVPPGTFDSYTETDPRVSGQGSQPWLRLELAGVRGPGAFSVFSVDSFGAPIVWMRSAGGVGADDVLFNLEGSHDHYNWAFTKPGVYQIDFRAVGRVGGQEVESDVFTFTFGVERFAAPATGFDLKLNSFRADAAADTVTVEYEVAGGALSRPVEIGFFVSKDGKFDRKDRLLSTVTLTTPDQLSAGVHSLVLPVDKLPGRGAATLSTDGRVLAVIDPRNRLTEADEANTRLLQGAYRTDRDQLFVFGTQGDDVVTFAPNGLDLDFTFNGVTQTLSGIDAVRLWLGDGNDSANASAVGLPAQMWGGAGTDTLTGSQNVSVLFGGAGNDSLTGGASNDLLSGDAGDDGMFGLGGNDQLLGGAGTNSADGGAGIDRADATTVVDVERRLPRGARASTALLRAMLDFGLE